MEFLYFINAFCAGFSGYLAYFLFKEDNKIGAWANVIASAVNIAAFSTHLF